MTQMTRGLTAPASGALVSVQPVEPQYLVPMDLDSVLLVDPDKVPADPAEIDDDTLISVSVWAALQGVKADSVLSTKAKAAARRKAGTPKPGDMPAEDETIGRRPYWRMGSYREWQAARPGKGAGAGRPPGSKTRKAKAPTVVELPICCPHCSREIRGMDLVDAAR